MTYFEKKWFSKKRSFGVVVIFVILFVIVTTFWTDSHFKIKIKRQRPIHNNNNTNNSSNNNKEDNNNRTESGITNSVNVSSSTNNNSSIASNKIIEKKKGIANNINIIGNNIISRTYNNNSIKKKKLILLWTPCYNQYHIWGWFASNEKSFLDCPYKCEFTLDRSLYDSSDALFVEGLPLTGQLPPPVHNLKNQIWAIFRIESPAGMDWSPFENKFNWTMSYRRDSDILWPAGRFVPIRPGRKPEITSMESVKNKTRLIAWTVSNCGGPSDRWRYVNILKKHVQVDIYGKCGNYMCPSPRNCYQELAPQYKFWLVFENSICADYVTEKMYQAMRVGIVPIIYGHPSFTKVAIPGSYINVYDFNSTKDLAEYLKFLDKNPKEYLKYFEWNKKFEILSDPELWDISWCDVCTKLNTMDFEKDRKWYPSIGAWYDRNNTDQHLCRTPNFDDEGRFNLS